MASLDAEALDISYSNLIQLTLGRTLEGFVPNHVSGPEKDVGITEPYVGARIALAIYKKWGDAWVIDLIIDALLSWNDWLWRRRRGARRRLWRCAPPSCGCPAALLSSAAGRLLAAARRRAQQRQLA